MFHSVSIHLPVAPVALQSTVASGVSSELCEGLAADSAFVARVAGWADADYSAALSGIWKSPAALYDGVPIGDAKFGGVALGMPGVDRTKATRDPTELMPIFGPTAGELTALEAPQSEDAPDAIHAMDVLPVMAGILVGAVVVFGLYANYRDSRVEKVMRWMSDSVDRRRMNDFERAMKGEDPFGENISDIKERIRRGEDGRSFLAGRQELWDDAIRALMDHLVEGREERIPQRSLRRRRINAIAEVRNLIRLESEQIFGSDWFPRVRESGGLFFFNTRYDNVDEIVRVARARLTTLEKAADANGKMDWAKAAVEELRLIDYSRFGNETLEEM